MKANRKSFSFVPERLKEAREIRKLTLVELAEKTGVTHQAISKMESGKLNPSALFLEKAVKVLNVPLSFFTKTVRKSRSEGRIVFYRSRAAATVKSKIVHERQIDWLKDIHEYLEELLEFPEVNIPTYCLSKYYKPMDLEKIDQIALEVRKYFGLGLGPISNIIYLLEKNGVVIGNASSTQFTIDACSVWERDGRPYILIGNEDSTAVRRRFSHLHELGHLVLHSRLDLREFKKRENYRMIEKEADRFASAFLLPKDSFGDEVMSSSFDYFVTLKKRWKVSIGAMVYRAGELGILSDYQTIYLQKKLSKIGRKFEPLDDEIVFEEPVALKQAISLLLEHKVKSGPEIVYDLSISQNEIERLANLTPGYLNEDHTLAKIIPFNFKKNNSPF